MSQELADLYVQSFSTNLEMKLQQTGSKLRGRVEEATHTGAKMASPTQEMGPISLRAPAGRFAPKQRSDADFVRRWVFPVDGEIDQLIDTFDLLKTIIDPKSKYSTNAAAAVGRAWDDEIIAAATRTSYIGQEANALTTEAFDTTGQRIADTFGSTAASGLTVAKLIEAKRRLRKAHVDIDSEPLTLVIGSQQESDLLNQVQVVSTEFNDKPVLVNGKVTQFLGFDIVYSERLTIYTTNTRGALAFAKSGLYLGMWQDMQNSVSKRTDLSGEPWDLYTSVSYGATRLQAGKVLQIGCLDSTGADINP
jgi:hypothetical protein